MTVFLNRGGRGAMRIGWVYLPFGLFVLFFGVLISIAGVTGDGE